ncbi:MAG: response regulator [Bacteroidetes bacterium]|nr:MAG: response regulator [Bacteroidota bacterium]
MADQQNESNQEAFSELRARAIKILRGEEISLDGYSVDDIKRLLNELHIYHIELELQNEELRETQRQLSLARDKYADLYQFAPVAYLTFDQNGLIKELNLAASNLLGRERKYLVNRPFLSFLPSEYHQNFHLLLNRALQTNEPQRGELLVQRHDSETIPVEVEAITARSEDGQADLCRMVMLDISERKKAEEATIRAQKMESLTVLTAGVAHDFNNLLLAMQSQIELAHKCLENSQNIEKAKEHLQKAKNATEHAADLTRQMLTYAGHGTTEISVLSLNTLLEENLALFNASSANRVDIALDLSLDIPFIESDPGQIQQVVMNLIINAVEAIGDKPGKIIITTDAYYLHPREVAFWRIGAQSLEPGKYVRLTVRDNGIGMDEGTAARIFDPFFTTKFTGRGLGLAAVLGIVKAHRGGIRVDSVVGKGTTFQIIFPASSKTAVSPNTTEDTATAIPQKKATKEVLVIDDEAPVREALKDIFAMYNQPTEAVSSGEEGIHYFRQHHARIQLVILDLTMPGLGGIETLKRLREINPGIPVIMSSGYTEEDIKANLRFVQVDGYLQKPYRIEKLIDTLRPFLPNLT